MMAVNWRKGLIRLYWGLWGLWGFWLVAVFVLVATSNHNLTRTEDVVAAFLAVAGPAVLLAGVGWIGAGFMSKD